MLAPFVPNPRLAELDSVDVAVSAADAYEAARHLDLSRAPMVHALFALRTLPTRLFGRGDGTLRLTIDDIVAGERGFQLLADEPGHGFVVGAIGRFWKPDIEWADVAPAEFGAFAEP